MAQRYSFKPKRLSVKSVAIVIVAIASSWLLTSTPEATARTEIAALTLIAIIAIGGYNTRVGDRLWRRYYHAFANAFFLREAYTLSDPRVIDGDTIDNTATGIRYRLANIDCPETGDLAFCTAERLLGERAKKTARLLVESATYVSVRPTFRVDPFGRRVAFVYVDGADLGERLLEARLAVRWRGNRGRWCGKNGDLAKLRVGRPKHPGCHPCHR